MGLDMYLSQKFYFSKYNKQDEELKVQVSGIELKGVNEIQKRVITWRKCNSIHNWFVKNCQDGIDECQEAEVTIEKLKELLSVVKEEIKNKDTGGTKELQCVSGFFFGSTVKDEWYWGDMNFTKRELTKLIKQDKLDRKDLENKATIWYVYQSSW